MNYRSEKGNLSSLFAAAEEFTDILNESSKYDELGVGSVSNKDKSTPKQLQWEMKRNDEFKRRKPKTGFKNNKSKSIEKKKNIGKIKNGKSSGGGKKQLQNKKRK